MSPLGKTLNSSPAKSSFDRGTSRAYIASCCHKTLPTRNRKSMAFHSRRHVRGAPPRDLRTRNFYANNQQRGQSLHGHLLSLSASSFRTGVRARREPDRPSPLPVASYLVNGPYLAAGENAGFFQSQAKRCSGLLDMSSETIQGPRRCSVSIIRVGKGRNRQQASCYW